jgi:hypothetical protein
MLQVFSLAGEKGALAILAAPFTDKFPHCDISIASRLHREVQD